jgi:hypothetical protein
MATALAVNLKLDGNASLTGAAGLLQRPFNLPLGQGNWSEMKLALGFGAGNNQANTWWADERTVAAGADDDLDLSGTLTNPAGEALALTALKLLLVAVKDADGVKKLLVGPQGLAGAFQGPWGGVGATNYKTVDNFDLLVNHPWGGYPIVGGTTDKLRVHNPGAAAVTYRILIAGVQ